MSAIAGVLHLDGRPCAANELRSLAERLRYRAPDGLASWRDAQVGFVHARIRTTPESEETQPVADAMAGLTIVFDGRLDNRDALVGAAADAGLPRRGDSDAAIALLAYAAFGDRCAERLLGDFAFAIWDAPRRRLFCARDAMGLKPFFYRVMPTSFVWASEVGPLAGFLGSMPTPNEGFVGEHLAGVITDVRDTLFQNIFRLPPAHTLTVDARGTHVRCYWRPDPGGELRYSTDEEYADHLAELVHRAVAARLRVKGPVGVLLSGGVDSSSVVGVGHRLCTSRQVLSSGIECFSLAMPGAQDETPFFTQVVERWGLPAHCVVGALPVAGQFAEEARQSLDVPMYPNAAIGDRLRECIRASGATVALTGIGADEWLGTSPWAYADLVKAGKFGALARRLRVEAAGEDFIGWAESAKAALWPLVPAAAKSTIRRALRRGHPPAFIEPTWAAQHHLRERLARHEVDVPFASYEQYDMWHEGASGWDVHALEMLDRLGARHGIEHWHPFCDRRIVEFGLALPAEQRWRDGRHKDLLRRSMAPHLPSAIAARLTSPSASHVLVDAMCAERAGRPFDDMTVERFGWVSGSRIRERFDHMRRLYRAGDIGYLVVAMQLWHALAIELWVNGLSTTSAGTPGGSLGRQPESVIQ